MNASRQKGHKAFKELQLTFMARIRRGRGKLAPDKTGDVGKGQTILGLGGHIDDLVFILV